MAFLLRFDARFDLIAWGCPFGVWLICKVGIRIAKLGLLEHIIDGGIQLSDSLSYPPLDLVFGAGIRLGQCLLIHVLELGQLISGCVTIVGSVDGLLG